MEKEIKQKTYNLEITEKEIKNPQVKRKMVELIMLRAQLQSAENTFYISEAEKEVMRFCPLFTPISAYGEERYPGEVGKLKSSRVILRKEK